MWRHLCGFHQTLTKEMDESEVSKMALIYHQVPVGIVPG
jgi:hypothetical protein